MLKKIDEKKNSINDISIVNDCINVLNSSKESPVYALLFLPLKGRLSGVPIVRILFLESRLYGYIREPIPVECTEFLKSNQRILQFINIFYNN